MDVVHPLPYQLSNFLGSGSNSGGYSLADYSFDYALGGIPFLSATRDQWPYSEGMAEIRKQQFDSSAEPGEQSIYGWWLRSQNSWTSGAGLVYQDPDTINPYQRAFDLRFEDSLGVDTWQPGQVSLLRRADFKYNLTSSTLVVKGYQDKSGNDAAFLLEGNVLYKLLDVSRVSITTGSAGTALAFTNFGDKWFLLATDGIFSGTNTTAGTKIWDAPAGTLTTGMISAVKQRIVAAWNNSLYILDMNNAGATTLPTTWTGGTGLVMVHPDTGWYWTDCTQGPSAIYASGCNDTHSDVYKFVSDLSGLSEVFVPIITASMPRGECIRSIFVYVGSFMGIATSRGFRVGELDAGGDVSYGPLLFEPAGGCRSITGVDRFMYVGSTNAHDGQSGLFRVDLGTAYQEASTNVLRYAYARDVYATNTTGRVMSVSTFGSTDRLIFAIENASVWTQSAQDLYATGYIQTARVRFNTEEPKLYKFLSVSTPNPLEGTLGISIIDIEGNEWPSLTYGPTLNPGTSDVTISQPAGGQKWIKLKFTLGRGAVDTTKGAILDGWQIKALPGSIRQRMINHTFLLFDEEKDKSGQRMGTNGFARSRFEAFKTLARAGDVVVFQELREDTSVLVVIDDWKYTQLGPPGPNGATLGGYLTVVLRTVAESI